MCITEYPFDVVAVFRHTRALVKGWDRVELVNPSLSHNR